MKTINKYRDQLHKCLDELEEKFYLLSLRLL